MWRSRDALSHTHLATSPKLQRQWMHVANGAKRAGKPDGVAIQEANAVVKRTVHKK
jgi:hypothetical protein